MVRSNRHVWTNPKYQEHYCSVCGAWIGYRNVQATTCRDCGRRKTEALHLK